MPVCYNHASMMICKKIISTITAAAAAVALFTVSVPVALAGSDNASRKAITSSRSFPKMNTARKDLLKETVSVSSDDSESWGGVESLNVPETKSTAEKKAEEEAKKAEEERKAAAEAARLQAAEVSRSRASAATSSTSSSSVSNDGAVNAPVSANGAGVVAYASQFQGVPYVCTAAPRRRDSTARASRSTCTPSSASACRVSTISSVCGLRLTARRSAIPSRAT